MEGRYKTSNKLIKNINNIFNGIFDNQYGMCYPVLNVIYEREYYIQNKSRDTIDANIKNHICYFSLDRKQHIYIKFNMFSLSLSLSIYIYIYI